MKKINKSNKEKPNYLVGILLAIVLIGIVGFSIKEIISADKEEKERRAMFDNIDMACVGFSEENKALMVLASKENTPDLLNCSQLAFIIKYQAYPSGFMVWNYRYKDPSCGMDNNTIVSSYSDPHIKESYDDYYFRECLTK